jgi:hypothetical protein
MQIPPKLYLQYWAITAALTHIRSHLEHSARLDQPVVPEGSIDSRKMLSSADPARSQVNS